MITDAEFERIVSYIKKHYGIDLSRKRILIIGRLENYLIRNGYASYGEYMDKVESNPEGKEAKKLINVLTTNHTYFMRENIHFEFMRKVALPQWKVKAARQKDLRIWSAAASTGEEPYTIAMVLKDFFGIEHYEWDTKILATDISTKVLERAYRGVYLKEQLEPLPERWRKSHFKEINDEEYKVKDELRDEVIFRKFNLMDPLPFKKKFHIVFFAKCNDLL